MQPEQDMSYHHLMRAPKDVMRLERMGSSFQHRLSFIRQLLRRAKKEKWQFNCARIDWDENGYGTAIYQAIIGGYTYSLIIFTQLIPDNARTDRVIAEQWDACFCLFDGVPSEDDIDRLRHNVPLQEKGRCSPKEFVLSRANKSMRLFQHIITCLTDGKQPDRKMIQEIGYLMRTTAVYGSGKFGCANREKYSKRPVFNSPFQVEMLSVYLFRWFTIDWVNHIAKQTAKKMGKQASKLDADITKYLGIGNSTGLGMAPFMVHHPILIHHWVQMRETALAIAFVQQNLTKDEQLNFIKLYDRAHEYLQGWQVADKVQSERITILLNELAEFRTQLLSLIATPMPYHAIYHNCAKDYSLEMQELMVSLLIEILGENVDDLSDMMSADEKIMLDPTMRIKSLQLLLEQHYDWALEIDFEDQKNQDTFWYYSEDKMEPRLGKRFIEHGSEWEMPLAVARDIANLYQKSKTFSAETQLAELLLQYPECRAAAKRAQSVATHPYGEIYDNLIDDKIRPIDLLRFKLSFFGISKFDPKSDLWTRVNLFQGAPSPLDLQQDDDPLWFFPANLS